MAAFTKKIGSFCRKNKRPLIAVAGLALTVAVAFAASAISNYIRLHTNTSGLIFTLNAETDTYEVTGYEGTSDAVVITGSYDGKKVSAVAEEAFAENEVIRVLSISDVPVIGKKAFIGCPTLQLVTVYDGVTKIGSYAFAGCAELVRAELADSVTEIGTDLFINCAKLKTLRLSDGLTEIPMYTCAGCAALTEIDIPDAVTVIGKRAFSGCAALTECKLPKNLRVIDDYAFASGSAFTEQNQLTKIELPESLEKLGLGAFYYGRHLETVRIPSGITEIQPYTFYECNALTRITLPAGLTKIGEFSFFDCTSLRYISLPDKLTEIGGRAFYKNPWVEEMADENGFTIAADTFFGYTGDAESVTLPSSGYSLVANVCYGSQTLKHVTVPAGTARVISKQAFSSATYLESVRIGEGVEVLGDSAFYYDNSLTLLCLPASLKTIEANVFEMCNTSEVLGPGLPDVYYAGTRAAWRDIAINETNPEFLSVPIVFESTGPEA